MPNSQSMNRNQISRRLENTVGAHGVTRAAKSRYSAYLTLQP
jgi:hypothetical protein